MNGEQISLRTLPGWKNVFLTQLIFLPPKILSYAWYFALFKKYNHIAFSL